ncbi:MAG TPA: tetratricopeptide repeat protein [Sedimentisphaerales bacterium]|nr:tetratricopeptide repeat protein [Sedimentisphaerales bacterium]HQI26844.1 tetratricopeptide repeat protein [Sedimentisphaerales bacterium]
MMKRRGPSRSWKVGFIRTGPQKRFLAALLILLATTVPIFSSTSPVTMPPSSYQSGLTVVPNPLDRSANLPITGNVAGGKHFRGSIPYNSTTTFGAPLGSTSLDSFLRYSATPDVQAGYPQGYSPFYSPTGTVTTTLPGYPGVFSPVSPRIVGGSGQARTGQPLDVLTMTEVAEPQASTRDGWGVQSSPRLGDVPMSTESGKTILNTPGDGLMSPQEYQQRLDQLLEGIERMQGKSSRLYPGRSTEDDAIPLPQLPVSGQEVLSAVKSGLEFYDPPVIPQETIPTPLNAAEPVGGTSTDDDRRTSAIPQDVAVLGPVEEKSKSARRSATVQAFSNERLPQETAEPPSTMSSSETQPRTYADSDSVTRKRFDQHLAAGQSHMRQDRYDLAVDSFRLACVYVPYDVRPHFGKSLALLATGDHVASAMSLIRALELDAGYVTQKRDLVESLGGPDLFVRQISRLQDLVEEGASPQLQLLLAYVYFQMDQTHEAIAAIEAVRAALPSSRAAASLQRAIQGSGR